MSPPRQLHQHIAALDAAFRAQGLRTSLSGDPRAYLDVVSVIPDYSLTSPLDHRVCDLASDMIWVGIWRGNELVAIECGRKVNAPAKAGGLNAIFNPQVFGRVLPVLTEMPPRNLVGRLGYLGGAWVHPERRGQRIMSLAVQLTIAHLVRLFDIAAVFAFVRHRDIGLALAPDGYAFTSADVVDLMYLPGSAAPEQLCMISAPRAVLDARYARAPAYQLRPQPLPRRKGRHVKSREESRH